MELSKSARRKNEHLELAHEFYDASAGNDFDHMHLLRPTLPETSVSLNGESLRTDFFGIPVAAPFFINAMTGGSQRTADINRSLARVAVKQNLAMALGSANIVAREPAALATFEVARKELGDGALVVNVNPSTEPETVALLMRRLTPCAVQIHVNAVQEIVMPEGDRDFHWIEKIKRLAEIAADAGIPVIVKEVGFGFDEASLEMLAQAGIAFVDVAGSGGTDFTKIENSRRTLRDFDYLDGVGLSAVKSLLNVDRLKRRVRGPAAEPSGGTDMGSVAIAAAVSALTPISSGGVRNPLDVLKSLALGAHYVGVSNTFLQVLREDGEDGLNAMIERWKEQLAGLLALFGVKNLEEARHLRAYFDADIVSYLEQTADLQRS